MATNTGPQFALGRLVATPGALEAIAASGDTALSLIHRHLNLDAGKLDAEDQATNADGVANGWRVLSSFLLRDGTKIWLITEADRSSTCLLLPDEY